MNVARTHRKAMVTVCTLAAWAGQAPAQEAVRMTRRGDRWHAESLFETDIPYLRGAEPAPRFVL